MNLKESKELLEETYIEEDIKSLSPKDRLTFYLGMLEYFQPKINRIGYDLESDDKEIIEVYAANRDQSLPRDTE